MYQTMESEIEKLTEQVTEQVEGRCAARRLMTHPGVGPVTALATEVFLGDPRRFADGKALGRCQMQVFTTEDTAKWFQGFDVVSDLLYQASYGDQDDRANEGHNDGANQTFAVIDAQPPKYPAA